MQSLSVLLGSNSHEHPKPPILHLPPSSWLTALQQSCEVDIIRLNLLCVGKKEEHLFITARFHVYFQSVIVVCLFPPREREKDIVAGLLNRRAQYTKGRKPLFSPDITDTFVTNLGRRPPSMARHRLIDDTSSREKNTRPPGPKEIMINQYFRLWSLKFIAIIIFRKL